MNRHQKRKAAEAQRRATEHQNTRLLLEQERSNNERLRKDAERYAKLDAERLAVIAQKDEAIRRADEKTQEARLERDRIVRIVDQFTSISIVPLPNSPKELRKT